MRKKGSEREKKQWRRLLTDKTTRTLNSIRELLASSKSTEMRLIIDSSLPISFPFLPFFSCYIIVVCDVLCRLLDVYVF